MDSDIWSVRVIFSSKIKQQEREGERDREKDFQSDVERTEKVEMVLIIIIY